MKLMNYFAEIGAALAVTLMGWLHVRQNKMEDKIENYVPKDAFDDMRVELKAAMLLLTELRVENAKWQGQIERVLERDLKNS